MPKDIARLTRASKAANRGTSFIVGVNTMALRRVMSTAATA